MTRRPILLAVIAALVVAACGQSSTTSSTSATTTPTKTPSTAPEPTAGSPELVTTLADVRLATVQIVSNGTFIDPEFGEQVNSAGAGSGFIIDEDGIAVTNNHVVTGAAFLDVYVADETEPRNAKVLGVSECSDLAVIDIDGDGFRYLDWYEGDIVPGVEIFLAGFPLGDEEYTLLDGIVAKADVDGETSWSSVDKVIEHSADSLPGTSGGPVVTADGQVVAVHYAGDDFGQSFAIGRDEAQDLLDELASGEDVTSIGVNGTAVVGTDFTGIWVSSVKSGSPAHKVGVRPGDIITRMEDLVLSANGTMEDYCDILRSHGPDDELSIEVFRFETSEVFEGVLNGKELELTVSFAQELGDTVDDGSVPTYDNYVNVTDDTGAISMSVPAEWSDVSGVGWDRDGEIIGASILASPDIDGWYATWDVPGVFFGASSSLINVIDESTLLDENDFSGDCEFDSRNDYSDPLYVGQYDVWVDCGGVGTVMVVVVAVPEDRSFVMLLQVIAITDPDFDALDTVLSTFVASGEF